MIPESMKARLPGVREDTGGKVEVLLLSPCFPGRQYVAGFSEAWKERADRHKACL